MTFYDDPNREAVGLEPIWTGAGEEAQPVDEEGFDPGDHTVDEVKAYVGEHPEARTDVIEAEEGGRNRTTLTDWLAAQEDAGP